MVRTSFLAAAAATLVLAACASSMTRAERLAIFQANAGEPLQRVSFFSPQSWQPVDNSHVVVQMRPSQQYLMRLSGPCLDWGGRGAAAMVFTSQTGSFIQPRLDRVAFSGSSISCRIEEIREINVDGVRAAMAQHNETY